MLSQYSKFFIEIIRLLLKMWEHFEEVEEMGISASGTQHSYNKKKITFL